ncbi:MAG: sulfatase-like hydrolase/transferase [Thermoleophilaceae bacterium]
MLRYPLVVAVLVAALVAPAPVEAERRPLVVVIAFDEFPVDSLLRPDARIDSVRYPGFGRLARIATWFPNAFSAHDRTTFALPAMLDGRNPRPGSRPTRADHPRNLFTLMAANGYQVLANEPFTKLCPPLICPDALLGGPGPAPFFLSKRVARFRATVRSIRPRHRPLLVFHHQILPHQPWTLLPSGRQYQAEPDPGDRGLSGPLGFHDAFLTNQNQQRHLLQVGFVDREITQVLDRLERVHLLNRALVVVTADHGIGFDVGTSDRRSISRGNIAEVAPVPLFVKAPGQRQGRTDRDYVSTVDVVPTIAEILQVGPLWPMNGRSAFRRRGRRSVRIPRSDFIGRVSITPAALERARAANRRHKARLFGTGTDSLFRAGRHRRLLGQSLADFAVGLGEVKTVGFTSSFAFDPSTLLAPIWFTGRVVGTGTDAERDLTLTLNGRVAAVGRTFRLRGSQDERFSLLAPESALQAGSNEAALFEVHGDRLLRLEPAVD